MYKILIIEDDNIIADTIKEQLSLWGYITETVTDFRQVMEQFTAFAPNLVLLDISLPFFNGFHWCSEMRKVSKLPVIFLSSASDNMNIVMAMNMGGDDFVAKPFDLQVLVAKVGALIRRAYDFSGMADIIAHDDVMLDLGKATLHHIGEAIELSKNEFKILRLLMENAGQVVSREDLMVYLWETDSFVDENTLTVNVNRLRKKLESIGLADFIKTRKGIGYCVL